MISQVGALLKSDLLRAQYLFLTTQGADVATYANAIHANLQSGKPVYDGYLSESAVHHGADQSVCAGASLQTIRGRWLKMSACP